MSKTKSAEAIMQEYDEKYGDIPLDHNDILAYLRSKYSKIDMNEINATIESIHSIPWESETYTIPLIPKPAARPRYSFESKHFYVPGSSTNKTIMKKILGVSDSLIMSRVVIDMYIFQPTPCYKMTQSEIYLAELGEIRPLIDPDVDNFAKAYLDAIQGVLIADDNIITDANFHKYFSVKPRIELNLGYQTEFDSKYNEKVIMERLKRMEGK